MDKLKLVILGIIVLASIALLGCLGAPRSELVVEAPDNIAPNIGERGTLEVKIISQRADANDVWVNVTVPGEIVIADSASKFFKTLVKEKETRVAFNFSARTAGVSNIVVETKSSNANATRNLTSVQTWVPVPKVVVGEYWVYKYKKGDKPGLHNIELLRTETIGSREYILLKETWEGEPEGAYTLSYRLSSTGDLWKVDYYENAELVKEKTIETDPVIPDYGYPFMPGKKWTWTGTMTGIGKSEMSGEITGVENITIPMGTYQAYRTKTTTTLPIAGTITMEWWYVPELSTAAKVTGTTAIGTLRMELEAELIEHGLPPNKPKEIQPKISIPGGYKLYRDEVWRYAIAYPKNWKTQTITEILYASFIAEDGIGQIYMTAETTGLLTKELYREYRFIILGQYGLTPTNIQPITVGRYEGYSWYYTVGQEKIWQVAFVSGGRGYTFSGSAYPASAFPSYEPIFKEVLKTIQITGTLEV